MLECSKQGRRDTQGRVHGGNGDEMQFEGNGIVRVGSHLTVVYLHARMGEGQVRVTHSSFFLCGGGGPRC